MIQALKGIPTSCKDSDLEFASSPDNVEAFQVVVESLPTWGNDERSNDEIVVLQPSRMAFMVRSRFDPDLYERLILDLHTSLLAGDSLAEVRGGVALVLEGLGAEIVDFVKS